MEFFSAEMRTKNAEYVAGYMGSLGMSTFVGFADQASSALWQPYLEQNEIDAAFHWTKVRCGGVGRPRTQNLRAKGGGGKRAMRGTVESPFVSGS